jgi:hypothetical protein
MRQLFAALLLALLVACGPSEPAAPPSGAATAPVAAAVPAPVTDEDAPAVLPPLPVGDFRITSLNLGKAVDAEGQVREPLETFAATDSIFAAVVSVGSSQGLTLSARWSAADGRLIASTSQPLIPTTPTVTTFSIAQDQPWAAGSYELQIAINGRVVETRLFQIQ